MALIPKTRGALIPALISIITSQRLALDIVRKAAHHPLTACLEGVMGPKADNLERERGAWMLHLTPIIFLPFVVFATGLANYHKLFHEAAMYRVANASQYLAITGHDHETDLQRHQRVQEATFDHVQLELNQFGLLIYNANVKQLVDVAGHEYFSYLGQKTQMEAANQARIDVAEARMKGEIGSKTRDGETLQNAAKIDAETKVIATQHTGEGKKEEIKVTAEVKIFENEREAEVAEANSALATKKASWIKSAKVAEVEAAKAVALRDAELQKEVETMNALTRTEKLKAELLSKASVPLRSTLQPCQRSRLGRHR